MSDSLNHINNTQHSVGDTPSSTGCRRRRIFGASLIVVALAPLVTLLPWGEAGLEYQRQAILGGEIWRLVTCHWTHFSWSHLFWDLFAMAILGLACERRDQKSFWLCLLISILVIPAGLMILMPDLSIYRGLSGLSSALFGLLIVLRLEETFRDPRPARIAPVALFALLFIAKTIYEAASGCAVFAGAEGDTWAPVPLVHLIGAVIGAAIALVRRNRSIRGRTYSFQPCG